jgi:elongation factor G
MDREGASHERALVSLRTKLQTEALPLQLPVGSGKSFSGVVDLVAWHLVTFEGDDGATVCREPLAEGHPMYAAAVTARNTLIDQASSLDEDFFEVSAMRLT